MHNHPEIEREAKQLIANFAEALPATATAFAELQRATFKADALDVKTKELIALAIAVAQGCDGCMAWHNAALHRLGATRAEVAEAAGVAVEMGGGLALYQAAKALAGYDRYLER